MPAEKKLFLLDGFALIYRSYFAFINNPRINSKGQNTSAMFGFTNTLLEVIKKENPSHIAVVFDPADEKSERTTDFAAYKAHRQEMPEDIRNSIPYIQQIIEAFNIPLLVVEGYEADDVIGTIAQKAEKAGFTVYIMSPDKDLAQLVTNKILWYRPGRMGNPTEVFGVEDVCKKFEIENPLQVIDLLGLMGDSADNIPGIPGVGEKTAQKFIKEFGSVEGLLANVDKLSGKMKEKVEQGAELAVISKKLATVILDVPIELDEKSLELETPNAEKLKDIFAELEFRNMYERVMGQPLNSGISAKTTEPAASQPDLFGDSGAGQSSFDFGVSEYRTYNASEVKYTLCNDEIAISTLIQKMTTAAHFCFDTETTGISALHAQIVGLSVAFQPGEAFYVPFPQNFEEAKSLLTKFKPAFENTASTKIGQNIKYDIAILGNYGIQVLGPLFDTMLAHYLMEPDQRHNMDFLAQTYLHYTPISIETLIGKKGKDQGNMRDVPFDAIVPYACEDADITYQLWQKFEPELLKIEVNEVFQRAEMPLVPVLADMEREGITVDKATLKVLSDKMAEEIMTLESEIHTLAGVHFNIASPKQLGDVLFEHLKLDKKAKKTKTGQYSTNEETLSKLLGTHEIIQKILDYREIQKLKSTYIDALPLLVDEKTGRVHTSYNQAVAATGRLSSNNPNLQNIPNRTTKGREIRKAFIPRNAEFCLLSADYSQVELRIIAALSNEENMIEAFREGIDIHTATAAKIYGISISEVTREMRGKAKMVNFGIIYGISAFGLAQRLGISRTESASIIEGYFRQYPRIKAYMSEQIQFARDNGYVKTILGRRRYLKDITSANVTVRGFAERNAINAPIQGSAADIIKLAMINIHREMKIRNMQSHMLLQVHDELVFDCHKTEVEALSALVREKMENAITLQVPLSVELNTGPTWLDVH